MCRPTLNPRPIGPLREGSRGVQVVALTLGATGQGDDVFLLEIVRPGDRDAPEFSRSGNAMVSGLFR